jgi:hypothetical protein
LLFAGQTMVSRPLVLAMLCSTISAASAQPGASDPSRPSPLFDDADAWIDRPLLLRPGQVQLGTALEISDTEPEQTAILSSASVGVNSRAQLGLAVTECLDPTTFGALTATAIRGYNEDLALRIDAGVSRSAEFGSSTNAYAFGVGAPIKVKLSPSVAFVSGSTAPTGVGLALAQGYNTSSSIPTSFGESILSVVANGDTPNNYVLTVPAGLLFSMTDRVAVHLHGALQMIYSPPNDVDLFVLAGANLLISLRDHVDLVASLDADLDETHTRSDGDGTPVHVMQLGLGLQGRF